MAVDDKLQLDKLSTVGDILEKQLRDPEFRAEWERTALARAVANAVVQYRTERSLSQRELAVQLGWRQPQVARLELGEHNPTIETLVHLVHMLGLSITVALQPAGRPSRIALRTEEAVVQEVISGKDGSRITIVTGHGSKPARLKGAPSITRTPATPATSPTYLTGSVDELIRQQKALKQQLAKLTGRSAGGGSEAARKLAALQRRLSSTLSGKVSKSTSPARARRTIADPAVLQARRAATAKAREALAAKRAAERDSP